ncbi:hypothetical protein CBER1_07668 [Cercospora berteroae]|uniref:Uncharacterized protein n=1 Tax=Cercospora berteroae TaxID=357750 RepID=A0A2S6C4I6_9PEZI|nr:hypothetical protein CBER1_07668 [Cercospora berteroae]
MGSAQSFSEWLTEDRLAEAYLLRNVHYGLFCDSSTRETYAPCNCNDCARFKRAADQIDDVQCWTDNDVSDSLFEAQKSLWRARKALHKLHMPELYLMDTPVTILAHHLTRTAKIGLERKELVPCSCDKCSTLIRRYREIEEAHEDGGDGDEYIRGLTLVVAAQTHVHSDVPFSVESDDDEPGSEPIEDLGDSSLSPADDGDNKYDEHA